MNEPEFYLNGIVLKATFPHEPNEEVALDWSILKWESLVTFIQETKEIVDDNGCRTCSLCWEYADNSYCGGCPVARKTGYYGCDNTPHSQYIKTTTWQGALIHAQSELDFLKSLKENER